MRSAPRAVIAIVALGAVAIASTIYAAFVRPKPAPDVSFSTIDGEPLGTAGLRGKVVLVNFWATSCVICVREMPRLAATYRKHRARGFETVAVAMRYDPPNYVLAYAERAALPFKVALDPLGEAAQRFGDVALTPTTFVIDRQGRIVKRYVGEPDFRELDALLEEKLAEAS